MYILLSLHVLTTFCVLIQLTTILHANYSDLALICQVSQSPWRSMNLCIHLKPVADLRGHEGRTPLPLGQNFFIFMQFSGKIGQIIGWHPPIGTSAPPLGNPGSATESLHLQRNFRTNNCVEILNWAIFSNWNRAHKKAIFFIHFDVTCLWIWNELSTGDS